MRIVIAGGHGQIALILQEQLVARGHEVLGIVRNPDHVKDVEATGASAVVLDLERTDVATLAEHLAGADATVFAAGGGPSSGPERKVTVDRDAAVLLADAGVLAGVRRIVVVSAMSADDHDAGSEEVFQIYLRAKSEADAAIRARDLDWTIVRPGGLTDEPGTGAVAVAEKVARGTIPRADVAALIVVLLDQARGVRRQFEVVTGDVPVGDVAF